MNPNRLNGGRQESEPMKHLSALLLVTVLVAGCARSPSITQTDEWVRARAPGPTVSVCYSATESTREQVMALALGECAEDRRALTLIGEDSALNDCPILKRRRVTFACVTPGTQGQVFP